MPQYLKSKVKTMLNMIPALTVCRLEFEMQSFNGFNERAIEFAFVFNQLAKLCPRKVLDVGTGTTSLPHMIRNTGSEVTAIDKINGYWTEGMSNRHYHIVNDDITNPQLKGEFDLVTCISVLEHIENHDAAVKNMLNFLKENGHLILTFPYSEPTYVKNVYELKGSNAFGKKASFITQSYSRKQIDKWCQEYGGEVVEQEFWKCWDGDFWTVGNQIIPPLKVQVTDKHDLSCIMIKKVKK